MEDVKIIKKRGRKPKDKPDVSTKVIEDFVNANMILHVPLYDSASENIASEANVEMIESEVGRDSLAPFDKNMMYMIEFSKDSHSNPAARVATAADNFPNFSTTNRKLYDTNNFFQDSGSLSESVKSDCVCFWDTEPFSSIAIGLPYKIVRNNDFCEGNEGKQFKYKYLVYGYFCSFPCAASYNFSLKDSQMSQRFVLLNNLYEDVFSSTAAINLAPPREMHKKFGGSLSTADFRSRSGQSIQYQNIIPPLMSLRCQIEEFYGNLQKKAENSVITLDDERVTRAQNNIEKLRLKRSTSVHNSKNNIESRMGIKIVSSTNS
jgi:hypothetical protein